MALTIQGSDYAYDKNGLEEALKNIKASIIDDAANKVSEGIDNIIGSVEQYWVGSGAEMFKKNLESDKKYITDRLKETYEDKLVKSLNEFLDDMQESDQSLVDKRER